MTRSLRIFLLFTFFLGGISATAQKKNSLVGLMGVLNHFYDDKPILMNTSYSTDSKKLGTFFNYTLIKSIGLGYSRILDTKSNLSAEFGHFKAEYAARTVLPIKDQPVINARRWLYGEICYNRKLINREKFQLLYGGGVRYRKGSEMYHVDDIPAFSVNGQIIYEGIYDFVDRKEFGATLNMNLKYTFWKNFFFYSKIDLQYYFLDFAKPHFSRLESDYPSFVFPRTKPINHTLTIGIGWAF